MNPRQKAYRKVETHPMKTEDLKKSLLQNPINPKMLQESLVLGKAKERMTCFPMERNGNISSIIIREIKKSEMTILLGILNILNTKGKSKFKKFN